MMTTFSAMLAPYVDSQNDFTTEAYVRLQLSLLQKNGNYRVRREVVSAPGFNSQWWRCKRTSRFRLPDAALIPAAVHCAW